MLVVVAVVAAAETVQRDFQEAGFVGFVEVEVGRISCLQEEIVEVDRISYQESGFVAAVVAADRIDSGFAVGAVVVVGRISCLSGESDFGVDRTDYHQMEELIDFAVEVGQTSWWWGLRLVDLVAVEFAECSAQRYQRYFAVAVVGSDFDLRVGH